MTVSLAAFPTSPARLRSDIQRELQKRGIESTLLVPDFWASQSHSTIRTQHGVVPFSPFQWQREFVSGITPREMILKSRDVGSSEICVRYLCWLQLKNGGNLLIKADKEENAKNLVRMARHYLMSLPVGERPTLVKDNETELELAGLGTIRAMVRGGGRSERCRYLLKTERAFWQGAAEEEAAISGALVAGGWLIQESTANGFNEYHADWVDPGSGYRKTFVGRDENPTHDAAWLAQKTAELSKLGQMADQEYPACVTAETRVGTEFGIMPVTMVRVGWLTGQGEITAQHSSGTAQTYRLTTDLSYSFCGSGNHPVILANGQSVRLDQIEPTQIVKLSPPMLSTQAPVVRWSRVGIDCSITITEDWALFLGFFMADGSYHHHTLSIVCDGRDGDVADKVCGLVQRLFGILPQTRKVGTKRGGTEVRVTCRGLREAFGELRIVVSEGGRLKRKVCVPDVIWNSPPLLVKAFLSGLFEGDGFSDYRRPRVMFFSRYEQFARDVQLLLLAFGVTSRLRIQRKRAGDGHYYEGHELALRYEEAVAFNTRIGFVSARKQDKCREQSADLISIAQRRPLIMEDAVASIALERRDEVFNLTISDNHLFDANGILTHNTSSQAFVASGNCLFEVAAIQQAMEQCRPPIATAQNGQLLIWQRPLVGRRYVAGADVAEGKDAGNNRMDYSVLTIIDWQTCANVATLRCQLPPDEFAAECATICQSYNNALLGVERNNHGHAVLLMLKQLGYPNIYAHDERSELDVLQGKRRLVAGWPTTAKTKPQLEQELAAFIKAGSLASYDRDFWDECLTYVRHGNGTSGAQEGCHDDLVIATGIALQMRKSLPPAGAQRRFSQPFVAGRR